LTGFGQTCVAAAAVAAMATLSAKLAAVAVLALEAVEAAPVPETNCIQLMFQISPDVLCTRIVCNPGCNVTVELTVPQVWNPPVVGTFTVDSTFPLASS